MSVYLELNDEALAVVPGQAVMWALSYGVDPYITHIETSVLSAQRIAEQGLVTWPVVYREESRRTTRERVREGKPPGTLTLNMGDDDNGRAVSIEGLYVLTANRPGRDYNTRKVTVADQRWFWDRTWIEKSYNVRRRTGDFRLVNSELSKVQLGRQRADYFFRPWSLRNFVRPWTAMEVMEDILREMCGPDGYVIDDPDEFRLQDTIEGLELSDPGPVALNRVMQMIPGAKVFIGIDGKAHVRSVYNQEGVKKIFNALPKGYAGDWAIVDKSYMRPSSYRVYFDREVELRFDYDEERSSEEDLLQTRVREPEVEEGLGDDPMWLENVIINPLYSLKLDRNGDRFATLGEAIPANQFIDACNLHEFNPAVTGFVLTKDFIREVWLGNWRHFRNSFTRNEQGIEDPERLKLLGALRTHFRQTYRIKTAWRNKIRAIMPNRASILDYETGTRAPAAVHTHYITKFTQLGLVPYVGDKLAVNNTDDYGESLKDRNISPFEVQILDSDMGIFRVAERMDQTETAETYVIGSTEGGKVPEKRLDQTAVLLWNQIFLDSQFKLAVVLTAIQDSPNNTGRLHMEEILPDAIFGEARGPSKEIFMDNDTARFAWDDTEERVIRDAFFRGDKYPYDLLVNKEEISALAAARTYSDMILYMDRVEGRVTGPLANCEPTGSLMSVAHVCAVGGNGRAVVTTTLNATPDVPALNVNALLSEGTRRKVRRLVQQ